MSEIKVSIAKLVEKHDLTIEESSRAFQIIMNGGATPAQIAGFLVALRMKGEKFEEITGAAITLRAKAQTIEAPKGAIDTCGTGGDAKSSLNISTATAFVVASCGVPVAKHGNKAISSKSGSADVLSALGVNIDADSNIMQQALNELGICFMMAPKYHSAMRHVAPIRQELGFRTIFNLLGPLISPAATKYQLIGVYGKKWLEPIAMSLKALGSESAWVVHSADGFDELTTTANNFVARLKGGIIDSFEINPIDFGFRLAEIDELNGGEAEYNAAELRLAISGKKKAAYYDVILLNSAAALLVAGKVADLKSGISMASSAIEDGLAIAKLNDLVAVTNK